MNLVRQIRFLQVLIAVATGSKVDSACNLLHSLLSDKVVFPGSGPYNESIGSYAYAGARVLPTCVAAPASTADVSLIVKTLGECDSVPFAIRSGGHSSNKGFANAENGITIDLRAIDEVQLSEHDGTVSIGAGALSQPVYDAVEPKGLSVQAGRIGDVGVGGLITNGGVSFFSPERGWICDDVTNFEVVLASGDVVNANATFHPDLFVALKGGGNNFGVVTRFDLKIFPHGPLWGGLVVFPLADDVVKQLLDAFTEIKDPKNFDPHIAGWVLFQYGSEPNAVASTGMYYTRPEAVNESLARTLTDIKPQLYDTLRNDTAGAFAKELTAGSGASKFHRHWAAITIAISPTILSRIRTFWNETSISLVADFPTANLLTSYVLQSMPPVPSTPNSLGFPPDSHPERNLISVEVILDFEDGAAAERLVSASKEMVKGIEGIAQEEGALRSFKYANYAGAWQDVLGGYGEESVRLMREVSKKYDPEGVFQRQVKGGFKLFA